jgi:GT2 family glycosyltransferase
MYIRILYSLLCKIYGLSEKDIFGYYHFHITILYIFMYFLYYSFINLSAKMYFKYIIILTKFILVNLFMSPVQDNFVKKDKYQ